MAIVARLFTSPIGQTVRGIVPTMGGVEFRCGSWRSDRSFEQLTPLASEPSINKEAIVDTTGQLLERETDAVLAWVFCLTNQASFLDPRYRVFRYRVFEAFRPLEVNLQQAESLPPWVKGLRIRRIYQTDAVFTLDLDTTIFYAKVMAKAAHVLPAKPQRINQQGREVVEHGSTGSSGSMRAIRHRAVHANYWRTGTGLNLLLGSCHWLWSQWTHRAMVNSEFGSGRTLGSYPCTDLTERPGNLTVSCLDNRDDWGGGRL